MVAKLNLISTLKIVATSIAMVVIWCGCSVEHSVVVSDITELHWHRDSARYLVIENEDSINQHSINIVVRYNPRSVAENRMQLAIEIQTPQGELYRDTVKCALGSKQTNELHSGQVRYQEKIYKFIDNAVLKDKGKYIIKINHFEQECIEGITAVGISIN